LRNNIYLSSIGTATFSNIEACDERSSNTF